MDDETFAKRLQELDAAGDIKARNELIATNGGMKRVIALAVRGAVRAKRDGSKSKATALPADFPDNAAREAAKAYWSKNRRPDLISEIDRQAEKFRFHFENVRRPSWPRTWATWYRNAVDYVQPPRGIGIAGASVSFEQTTVDGWVSRLMIYFGKDSDCPAGTWSPKWGPQPDAAGCRVPAEAKAKFSAITGQKVA